ncbi:TetR/AcrR family transcriptional regulator [Gordonia sp. CPCC 205333]|uniref:TetR/AcrR family transcriptional regulator n=1 Tax=Gordonia sp. CPCC 205333 TaxID=3140790 RepID=UPI003AF3F191
MPPTQRRPSDDDLLDAALEEFAKNGYANTSMGQIAEVAQSTKPTLYAHFGSKQDLFNRVIQRELMNVVRELFPYYDSVLNSPLEDSVDILINVGMNYIAQRPQIGDILRISLELSPDPIVSQLITVGGMFVDKISELIEAQESEFDGSSITSDDLPAIAAMVTGSGAALGYHILTASDVDRENVSRIYSQFLRGALRNLAK